MMGIFLLLNRVRAVVLIVCILHNAPFFLKLLLNEGFKDSLYLYVAMPIILYCVDFEFLLGLFYYLLSN